MTDTIEPGADLIAEADAATERLAAVKDSIGRVIFGLEKEVELCLTALLSGGHTLLVGAPGLAKTRLVETIAVATGLDTKRIQFTPDLMPADILGSEILEESDDGKRHFRFLPGPIFCRLLMADEINRASPRTQAALLQAMQEGHVTVAGERHDLPHPFHVLATQNPIEQEGTYPLPEAQLDRFLLRVDVPYPDRDAERQVLLATTGATAAEAIEVLNAEEIIKLQSLVRRLPVGEKVLEAILDLLRLARPDESEIEAVREGVSWGPGPRAGQAMMLACRARALLQGRLAPSTEDVAALAEPILKHRMALSFAARADGHTLEGLIQTLADQAA
ncbi:MAG: MoxR family ATPase [Maricaulis sp.]|jgi:MoxR-like ATPase|uniref:AAA family ATPase n=1 Tax=Maricaulis sp. TaxID=1486257 RepID=UPI001AFD39D0|nr:MoxR family ATPase [Maricaulis sp.]MBO6729796.1 MoxR family ATPase [Maricaulis sp.]MBO6847414.1 MoxR family ATPase [Maricaulis sp.]MBO6878262.1 MoxR family ATPase [Maricaulis sp.]